MFPLLGMLIDQDIHEHTEHILLHSQVESLYFVGHTVVVKVGDRWQRADSCEPLFVQIKCIWTALADVSDYQGKDNNLSRIFYVL